MDTALAAVIEQCLEALAAPDPQGAVERILLAAAKDSVVTDAISSRTRFASLEDLAIHRSDRLTLLAGALPPKFRAGPHNHNLWSVVGVCAGQENNEFFEQNGKQLTPTGTASVIAPGVLANPAEVIHAIHNPLDAPLIVLHAYGGDLFATPRSSWDPATHEEIAFDWKKVSTE
jgi:predicted metal-dependent enzyme (double-stranded beta helix superfamily)